MNIFKQYARLRLFAPWEIVILWYDWDDEKEVQWECNRNEERQTIT